MSGTGEGLEDFAGEERAFRIRLGEIRRIEDKCEAGIGLVLGRLSRAAVLMTQLDPAQAFAAGVDVRADDVRTVIYEGLVGGGMAAPEASKLVRAEIDERGVRGIFDHVNTALAVLWGSQRLPEGEGLGEPQAGENPATPPSA
jgi:hypothetical protein